MRKTILLGLVAVVAFAAPAGAGSRAEQQGIAGPGAIVAGYLTPTINISKGDSIAFANFDIFEHNIVHDVDTDGFGGKPNVPWCKSTSPEHAAHAGACPVFHSELISAGATTQVEGLNRVKRGKTYSFFCTEHHSMKGKLVVGP